MTRALPDIKDIEDDVPLRLDVAARLAFPDGSITLSSLRNEARKGRLTVWRIANKDMTTLAEIRRIDGPMPRQGPASRWLRPVSDSPRQAAAQLIHDGG